MHTRTSFVVMMLYINDLLITKNDIEKIECIMEEFKQTFEFRSSWHGVQDLFTRYIHDSKNIRRKNIETIWNDE